MAAKKSNPVQELAKVVKGKVKDAKRNQRILVDGRTVAVVWTRGSGKLAVYAQGDPKVTGNLRKHTETTSEGIRLHVTTDELAAGELGLATELVKLAAEAVAAKAATKAEAPAVA